MAVMTVALPLLLILSASMTLALVAILIRKRNPKQSLAVLLISIPTALLSVYVMASYSAFFLLVPIVVAIVFLVLAIVKKNLALLLTTISVFLVILLMYLTSGIYTGSFGCGSTDGPDEYDNQLELQFESNGDGTCSIVGSHRYSGIYPSTCFDNETGVLTIPAYAPSGERVTEVKQIGSFSDAKSIVFTNGIEKICTNAFENTNLLTSVEIPVSIQEIGENAFGECTQLSTVIYHGTREEWRQINIAPNNAYFERANLRLNETSSGEYLVLNYSRYDPGEVVVSGYYFVSNPSSDNLSLSYIPIINGRVDLVIPKYDPNGNEVVGIGENAFANCSYIQSITFSSMTGFISASAFSNCENLRTVDLGGVTRVGEFAFKDCSQLSAVIGLEKVALIGEEAFCSCISLQNVTFGNSLYEIGRCAFADSGILHASIPASVSTMGGGIFMGCRYLNSVDILASVDRIPTQTFEDCISLNSVYLSKSINGVEYNAFYNCIAFWSVLYEGSEEEWGYVSIMDGNNDLREANMQYYASPAE